MRLLLLLLICLFGCSVIQAKEVFFNPEFRESVRLDSSLRKHFEKNRICFSGQTFPRFWTVALYKGGGGKVSFSSETGLLSVKTEGEGLRIQSRNYRIMRRQISDSDCKLMIDASGKGSVVFGFFCYDAKGKYLRTVKAAQTLVFDGGKQRKCLIMPSSQIPLSIDNTAVLLIVHGELDISRISCQTVQPAPPVLPPEFKLLSDGEKISRILQSSDYELPLAALADPSPTVRNRACYKLGDLGSKALPAREYLAETLLNDSSEPVRVHAARALCCMGSAAYNTIRRILLGGNHRARLTLGTSIRAMKNGVPTELEDAVEWASPPVALTNASLLPDGDFEGAEGKKLIGWTVEFKDGATGSYEIDPNVCYRGEQSLKITKDNGKGYIILRSKMPVTIPAADKKILSPLTFRFFFRTVNASYNTLLLPRFITAQGDMLNDDPSLNRGWGIESQSRIRNTPSHAWSRRCIMFKPKKRDYELYPAIIIYGNPLTVWIDNVQFPATPFKVHEAGPSVIQSVYTLEDAEKIISGRPCATAAVVREKNRKLSLLLNGTKISPVLYKADNYGGDCNYMYRHGGVKLHLANIRLDERLNYPPFGTPWNGKEINWDMIFSGVENAIRRAPDATFILGVSVMLPRNFVDKNPEEAWIDAKGQKGYGNNVHLRGFGKLPDSSYFYWPSQYSDKAWSLAEDTVRNIFRELKKKPYSKAIAGVFIAGGHDGQFMIHRDDYSKPALAAWRRYLRDLYGKDDCLAKAWNRPGVRIETAEIPVIDAKELHGRILFDPAKYRNYIDYREFREARIWQNSARFARIFKEEFGKDKIAMTYCMGGGWMKNFAEFFKTDYDAFVPQPSYCNRLPGLSGGLNMVADSFLRHGKLVIAELDTRNWMRCIYNEVQDMWIGVPYSKRQFQTQVMKDAGRQIANGHGYWYYDIGSNSYRHPEAVKVIGKVREVSDIVAQRNDKDSFVPDVALVYHQKSIFYDIPFSHFRGNWASHLLDVMAYGLRRSGVPMAAYFLDDLIAGDNYRKHKIFIFMNAHMLQASERDFIERNLKKNGNVIVWIHSTGMLTEHAFRPELTEKLTNFHLVYNDKPRNYEVRKSEFNDSLSRGLPLNMGVADTQRRYYDLRNSQYSRFFIPCFEIDDKDALILGRFNDGKAALGVKRFRDWTSVFCAAPGGLDAELLHNLAKEAGCYTVTRPGVLCEVNSSFLSLHSCVSGVYSIQLPGKARFVRNAMTGEIIAKDTDCLKLELPAWKSIWLLLE